MTQRIDRRRLFVAITAVAALVMVVPMAPSARSASEGASMNGTVLVVAPHPDDDVIMAAGITYNRPNTVIAYMTNGESHSRDEIGSLTAVASTTQFTDSTADFSDMPAGTKIEITTVTPPSGPQLRTVTAVVNATTITIDTAVTGLAVGDTYATYDFVPVGIAATRQAEAVAGQAILGRSESNLRFLGYPDFYLKEAWETYSGWVWGEGAVHHATFASRGLGGTDWHNYRTGSVGQHADYNHENMLEDMIALIDDVRPDHVITTSPEDGTSDHRITYAVVKEAIEAVAADDPGYGALLHTVVVWQDPPNPILNAIWPNSYPGGAPTLHTPPPDASERAGLGFSGDFEPNWDDRQTYLVPEAMRVDPGSQFNPKWEAIQAHASQAGLGAYISNFFHRDEFFWVEAVPAAQAADDGPYNVQQGKSITTNGVLDNDVGYGVTAAVVSGPAHAASFTLNPNGSFTYTHDGSSTTADSFTYRATDAGGGTSVATVSVTITLDPSPPPPPPPPPPGAPVHSIGLVDPGSGLWRLYDRAGTLKTSFYYGSPGDYPIYGDWNCDGIETPGLYRQSDGYVYLRNTNTQGVADVRFFFGNPGDIPLAGDFDNDGCDTVSIYRPSESRVFIINELGENDGGLGAADVSYFFGNPGDKPFVGDFNGNGVETIGLHRESTGFVYFRNTHTQGTADTTFFFGDPGDRLVAGDWNDDGRFSPALFRPANTTMYFRYTNTQGNADSQWTAGASSWIPVAGYNGLG